MTVFAIIDSDSPRKLLTAFEFFELQNSFQDIAVVLCFKNMQKVELQKLCKSASFLSRMNLVIDLGNAESFLRMSEQQFMTFSESEEKTFSDYEELLDYLQLRSEYLPTTIEDKTMYRRQMAGNRFVVNGVANPLISEVREWNEAQKRYFIFYFDKADNLDYLLNEIVQLQNMNLDCYFAVGLSNDQQKQIYYLTARHPQLNDLNLFLDEYDAGKTLIEPGHTHVVLYQQMDEQEGIFGYLMELNEVLAKDNVDLQRGEIDGIPNFAQDENAVVFQGVTFPKLNSVSNYDPSAEVESTDRRKIQGRYVLCLINPVFDYDSQLYRFYQIQNKVNMDLLCCFVGASDRELKQITNKLKVLNELTMLRDTSKQGAIILKKAGTNLRFYMINKENQVYNTADDAGVLEDLIRNEFGEHYYEQTEQGAYIEATNPKYLTYEGRIYKYLNNHVIPTAKVHRHVTVTFVTL